MQKIVKFLKESEIQYLATIGLDGKPKVRPFQFMFEQDGKLWFCTSNHKEVYRELQKQAYVEVCASDKNMHWLRLSGKVEFSKDLQIKERILNESALVKGIYTKASNPAFEVFFMDEAVASISGIGLASQIIKL